MTGDDRTALLIRQLAESARPVRRLRPPAVRLAAWLGVLLAVGTVSLITGLRPDASVRLATPGFPVELALLAIATTAAALVALRGSVPGLEAGNARRVFFASVL